MCTGQYPAIDRILARQQGLRRLQHGLSYAPPASNFRKQTNEYSRPVPGSLQVADMGTVPSKATATAQQACVHLLCANGEGQPAIANTASCQQQLSTSAVKSVHQSGAHQGGAKPENAITHATDTLCRHASDTPASHANSLQLAHVISNRLQPQPELAGWNCSQQPPNASDAAHQQYIQFKFTRQQRLAAAVTIQRHARGLLARMLVQQMQLLRQYTRQRQKHVLTMTLKSWHQHASMRSTFR